VASPLGQEPSVPQKHAGLQKSPVAVSSTLTPSSVLAILITVVKLVRYSGSGAFHHSYLQFATGQLIIQKETVCLVEKLGNS